MDDVLIIWKCGNCGHKREDVSGYNEGGTCNQCYEGEYQYEGESYY